MAFPSLVRTGTAGTLPATLDIVAVPARTAMVLSGRQAASKAASRFCMIGRARRARMARMARMATVQHRLKCSVERQPPSYRRDGDRKSERDERTAGEACSGRARGLAGGLLVRGVGVPRMGHPPGPSTTVARRQPTEDGLFLPEATLLERGRGWCNVETREAEQRVRRSCHVSQANDMATAE